LVPKGRGGGEEGGSVGGKKRAVHTIVFGGEKKREERSSLVQGERKEGHNNLHVRGGSLESKKKEEGADRSGKAHKDHLLNAEKKGGGKQIWGARCGSQFRLLQQEKRKKPEYAVAKRGMAMERRGTSWQSYPEGKRLHQKKGEMAPDHPSRRKKITTPQKKRRKSPRMEVKKKCIRSRHSKRKGKRDSPARGRPQYLHGRNSSEGKNRMKKFGGKERGSGAEEGESGLRPTSCTPTEKLL